MAHDDDYNGQDIVIVSISFLVLTYIAVLLRCFVRLRLTRAFALDDWFMLVAQANFTLSCGLILRSVHYGLGHHNASLPPQQEIQAVKYQVLATTTYVANMMFIKLSIAVFLLRLAVERRYIYTLWISMGVVTIWSTAIFFYDIFQCTPVEAQWDTTIKPSHCVSGESFVSAAYSISVLSILSDWLYALMPVFMIWSVQMSPQKKITVGFILSMGIFASIATIIRLKYLSDLADFSDALYTGTIAMVWTLIEPGVAITAASLVTIRPLLRALRFKGFESEESAYPQAPTHASNLHRSHHSHHIQLRDDIPAGNWSNSVISETTKGGVTRSTSSEAGGQTANDSDSSILVLQGVPGESTRSTPEPFVVTRTVGFEVMSTRHDI